MHNGVTRMDTNSIPNDVVDSLFKAVHQLVNVGHEDTCNMKYVPLSECPCYSDRKERIRKYINRIKKKYPDLGKNNEQKRSSFT